MSLCGIGAKDSLDMEADDKSKAVKSKGGVFAPIGDAVHKRPPTFQHNPFSYVLYLWFGPLLRLVRGTAMCFDSESVVPQR